MDDIASRDGFRLFDYNERKITRLKRLQLATDRRNDLEILSETINVYKNNNKFITEGLALKLNDDKGIEYVVLRCDPPSGYLHDDTIVYVEQCVPKLQRLDLLWSVFSDEKLRHIISSVLKRSDLHNISKEDIISLNKMYGPYYIKEMDADGQGTNPRYNSIKKNIIINEKRSLNGYTRDVSSFSAELFDSLFNDYISERLSTGLRIYYFGQHILLGNLKFYASNAIPMHKPGFINKDTEVYLSMDPVQECSMVSISPIRDTLPSTYDFDLLNDYIRPFFRLNPFRIYHQGDMFSYNGIQFRILKLFHQNPKSILTNFLPLSVFKSNHGRITNNTEFVVEDSVLPRLLDLLPREKLDTLRRTPLCYRGSLLSIYAYELDSSLLQRLYITEEDCLNLTKHDRSLVRRDLLKHYFDDMSTASSTHYDPTPFSSFTSYPLNCTVCYEIINESMDDIICFPCGHVFHNDCAGDWVILKKSCPNCRFNILDSINYLNTLSDEESNTHEDFNQTTILSESDSSNNDDLDFNTLDYYTMRYLY